MFCAELMWVTEHLVHLSRVALQLSGDLLTVRRVLEHQALQFRPLRVQSLHQFVGVYWVSEVALWVRGGRSGQIIQLSCPAATQTDKLLNTYIKYRTSGISYLLQREDGV